MEMDLRLRRMAGEIRFAIGALSVPQTLPAERIDPTGVTFSLLALLMVVSRAHDLTDTELIDSAARGDRTAFESLYFRHWKAVYSYAWLLARSVADAEDITQECFLTLIRKPKSFDPARAQLRTLEAVPGLRRPRPSPRSKSGYFFTRDRHSTWA